MWWVKKNEAQYWIKRLKKKNPDTCRKAAEELGKIGDALAVAPLADVLERGDVSIRWEAAEALGRIGDPSAVEPLMNALKDNDWNVRKNAAWALGKIGDIRAVKPLIQAFYDKDADVRREIVVALGEIGDIGVVKTLLNALDDKMFTVRWKAVQMLGKICDARAIEPLMDLLHDSSSTIQEASETALKNICSSVEIVMFGNREYKSPHRDFTFLNPDVSHLTILMSSLEQVEIYTDSYDFQQVERFVTYAVSHIGQKYLKKHVEVHIYGNPDKLHPNLRNTFENLCKRVEIYGEES